jgi:hypothetical protein
MSERSKLKVDMTLNRIFQALLVLSVACAAGIGQAQVAVPDAAERAQLFSYAAQLYHEGRWSGAYGRFARLADAGDAEAARVALHMLRMGSTLYGTDWGASQPQIDQWTRLAGAPLPVLVSVSGD